MQKRTGLAWLAYAEPAMLRAVWVAVVGLLTSVGVTVSTSLDGRVGAVIAAVAAVLPLLQGVWTRGAVFSPQTVEEVTAQPADQVAEQAAGGAGEDPYGGELG